MKCMLDPPEGGRREIEERWKCTKYGDCYASSVGLYQVIDKYYNKGKSTKYKWSELNDLLQGGDHYILLCRIPNIHTYFLEFKNSKFRILSLWGNVHGFLDFPFNENGSRHPWAYFDGHEDFDTFLQLLRIINGDIDLDSSDETSFNEWTSIELRNSLDIVKRIFNVKERLHRETHIEDEVSLQTAGGKGDMTPPQVFRIQPK